MRPRSGATRPAIMLTIEVLPEPDAPNSAVTPPAVSNFAASENSPSLFSTSTASISIPVVSHAGTPREPLGCDQRGERDNDRHQYKSHCRGVATGHLRQCVDRGRDRLRLAGDVGDEGDGGAELAERLG